MADRQSEWFYQGRRDGLAGKVPDIPIWRRLPLTSRQTYADGWKQGSSERLRDRLVNPDASWDGS